MAFIANGAQVEFFESKGILKLKEDVNQFLIDHSADGTEILDLRYQSDKEEYGKHFTAMIVYRTTQ